MCYTSVGRIWGLALAVDGAWRLAELGRADLRIASFGEDEAGELYLVAMDRGERFRVTALER